MASSQEPNSGLNYGWALGESSWNTGMDANLLKLGRALCQLSVKDKDLTAPTGGPTSGDRYIVGASATGDWATHDGKVAVWDGSAWVFYAPANGWRAYVEDENLLYVYDGSWAAVSGGGGAALDVTDGSTTVSATDKITFAGATVTDSGGGDALVTINPATGDPADLVVVADGTDDEIIIDVSSLPAGDLEITFEGRSTSDPASAATSLDLRFGATAGSIDSGTNYTNAQVIGIAASSSIGMASSWDTQTQVNLGFIPSTNATSGQTGVSIVTVHNYKNTSRHKAVTYLSGVDYNDASRVSGDLLNYVGSGQWRSTAAIGAISIRSGATLVSGSVVRVRVKGVPASPQLLVKAYRNAALDATTSDIALVYDTAIKNVGGCYNTTTGLFTAPASGLYEIRAKVRAADGTTSASLQVAVDFDPAGTNVRYDAAQNYHNGSATIATTVMVTTRVDLEAGNTLNFKFKADTTLALHIGDRNHTNLEITRLA